MIGKVSWKWDSLLVKKQATSFHVTGVSLEKRAFSNLMGLQRYLTPQKQVLVI